MFALIGLGNPGAEYEATRHNAGVWVVERLGGSANWSERQECRQAKVTLQGVPCLLAVPQSYMNLSGGPVQTLCQFYKIPADELVVIYDEIDLPPGTIRVRRGGSAGGHNGLSSIIERLGTRDFFRIRVGIGRPERKDENAVSRWVLSKPGKEDRQLIDEGVVKAAEAAEVLVDQGLEIAQRKFN